MRFRDLQNYTTLKQMNINKDPRIGFRDLQNYTTLKRRITDIRMAYCFRDLHVNDTLRMYKNDDIRMYNFNCITDTIVEVITTCNTYTLLTVHLL